MTVDANILLPCRLQTFAAHAARFGFPRHSLERLPNVTPALLEAIYALACRMGGSSCLSLAYDIDARALERSFLHRAEVALGRPDESGSPYLALELVQAQALLANLMYILGRPMDGHRHAGGALRLATSLRLQHASVADERAETWWMVYAVDRAWASVTGASPSPIDESSVTAPFPGTVPSPDASLDGPVNGLGHGVPSALDMLCMPPTFGIDVADPTAAAMGLSGSGEALGAARFKVLALHARAQEIIASCSLGRPMPQAMLAHASSGLSSPLVLLHLLTVFQALMHSPRLRLLLVVWLLVCHSCLADLLRQQSVSRRRRVSSPSTYVD